ncbi:MAG: glycosyltransferase, partial [Hymenobacter sp.]|nr:glycosyltransferase [Hymenobacter sp.]
MVASRLCFTVTTDLNYDQRMQRICGSLARAGYEVWLIGREWDTSRPLTPQPYQQHRLRCWFQRGKLFYLEFNLRLLLYLLPRRAAAWCAIDLDTALPVWLRAWLGGQPFVYDAHELFTEVPEVVARPAVQRVWRWVEGFIVPRARLAYTVGPALARVFEQRYGRPVGVIRNISCLTDAVLPPA